MAGRQEMMDVLRKKSSEELSENIATSFYDEKQQRMARFIIEEREREERKQEFKKMLEATRDNAKSTKRLVWATCGLVIVTFLLVLLTWLLRG